MGGETDVDGDMPSCVFPTLVWKHVIQMLICKAVATSPRQVLSKSGGTKEAEKTYERHAKEELKTEQSKGQLYAPIAIYRRIKLFK